MDDFFSKVGTFVLILLVLFFAINDIYNGHFVGVIIFGICAVYYFLGKSK